MNSSATFHRAKEMSRECELVIFMGGILDHTNTEVYVVFVFISIMNIITFPIITVLNTLVIIAVKTKPRLKTVSNIALGCLATTDVVIGMIGQPLFFVFTVSIIQGGVSSESCKLQSLPGAVIKFLATASLFHLVLMNLERYIAIKHSYNYMTIITKARILRSSALGWIITFLMTVPLSIIDNSIFVAVSNICGALCVSIIISCQAVLYFETRRHVKEIAGQQVSVEAREKFLKDKKALKLTTTVLFFLVLTYFPIFVVRILIAKSIIDSINVAYIALITSIFLIIFNSLINPIIYCVRIRAFRVAFIAILCRMNNAQTGNIEMRVLGTLNAIAPLIVGPRRESKNM